MGLVDLDKLNRHDLGITFQRDVAAQKGIVARRRFYCDNQPCWPYLPRLRKGVITNAGTNVHALQDIAAFSLHSPMKDMEFSPSIFTLGNFARLSKVVRGLISFEYT